MFSLLALFFGLVLCLVPGLIPLGLILFLGGVLGLLYPASARRPQAASPPRATGLAISASITGLLTTVLLLSALGNACSMGVFGDALPPSGPYTPEYVASGQSWTALEGGTEFEPLEEQQGPSTRVLTEATYSVSLNGSLMFGGLSFPGGSASGQPQVLGDTWEFANGTWSERTGLGSPSPRYAAALCDDPADHEVLLFGGTNGTSLLGDTWTFRDGEWHAINESVGDAPSPRMGASMTYDPQLGAVLLFGGLTHIAPGPAFSSPAQDTWEFQGGHWTSLALPSGSSPPARGLAGITYDPSLGAVMVAGTLSAEAVQPILYETALVADTWVFNDLSWKQLSIGNPPGGTVLPAQLFTEPGRGGTFLLEGSSLDELTTSSWISRATSAFAGPDEEFDLQGAAAAWWDNSSSRVIAFGGLDEEEVVATSPGVASSDAVPAEPICIWGSPWVLVGLAIFVPLTLLLSVSFLVKRGRYLGSRERPTLWDLADEDPPDPWPSPLEGSSVRMEEPFRPLS